MPPKDPSSRILRSWMPCDSVPF